MLIRRPSRFALLLASIPAAIVMAYGCGGGGGSDPDDAGTEGGEVVLPDGAILLPDGNVVPADGGPNPDSGGPNPDSGGDGGADAAVDAGPDTGPLWTGYVHYDVNHIIMTGQSNALSQSSVAPRTTTDYANLMFTGGPFAGANPGAFIALAAGDGGWAANGMADRISKYALEDFQFGVFPGYPTSHDILISNNARSGETYWCLRKGSCPYRNPPVASFSDGIAHVTQGMANAAAEGKTFVVRAITNIHGEDNHQGYVANNSEFPVNGTDGSFNTIKDYSDGLLNWQKDYETDIKAVTGQAIPIPMLISQLSGWNDIRFSVLAQYQYLAHKRSAGKVVLVGASYPFQFFSDCRHFTGASRRQLGEYFAKAYKRIVFEGKAWEPVRPMTVTRAGAVITVKFYVPVPPLAFDTVLVPAAPNHGFDFLEDGVMQTITNVALAGPDTVQITLSAAPGPGEKKLRYAQNQIPSTCQGIGSNTGLPAGARGNLRDSDPTVSRYGYDLKNWGVAFEEDVP